MSSPIKALLGYLAESEDWDYVKPFEIKGRRAPGQPRSNIKLASYDVEITDVRGLTWTPTIETCGFQWVHHATSERFESHASIASYVKEMEVFVKDLLSADCIFTLEYMIRKRTMDPNDPSIRPPSNFVHVDVSPEGAEKRLLHRHPESSQMLCEKRYRYLRFDFF
ncbi:uncharacterized protein LTHEOB_4382 [Lasiodiplodia theobromae]|uniref:uncharacterized protein n=1 Tax=Lasiodiplodia theobromae TaxID=45133 RepID=UPI0015C33DC6|nr:uncharacterized protein LTHEOB_4382 [Lasiodiplodia theobromae]KAF4546385.1 hypothetical protein LTHEOB_4382 [Lasiodiplodia theobromae]